MKPRDIPGRLRLEVDTTQPELGPGSYTIEADWTSRSSSYAPFGTGCRREIWRAPARVPGPRYDTSKRLDSGKQFPRARREYFDAPFYTESMPDHALHQNWRFKRSKTSGSDRVIHHPDDNPGPGYSIVTPNTHVYPSIGDFAGRRPDYVEKTPGPGKYEHSPPVQRVKGESPAFRGELRDSRDHPQSFGMMWEGPKDWVSPRKNGPPFSSRAAKPEKVGTEVPGPGSYFTDDVSARLDRFQSGQPRAGSGFDDQYPNYVDPRQSTPSGAARFPSDITPGPGPAYLPQGGSPRVQPDLGGRSDRTELFPARDGPAPGEFEAAPLFEVPMRPSPTIISKYDRDCLTRKEPSPGPAFYVPPGHNDRVWTFPGATRRPRSSEGPGPGEYVVVAPRGGGPAVAFSRGKRPSPIKQGTKWEPMLPHEGFLIPSYNVVLDPALKERPKF